MKARLFILVFIFSSNLFAQTKLEVGGSIEDSNVFLGNNNTVVNQIFGKSPEYAELKKRLADLSAAITKKADKCEKYTDPLAKEDCRAELIALNAERDSVQKIETRFREDVIRLAETFSRIEINSERLRLAKKFFDEGKISEADNVLQEKDMAATGDAALAVKVRNDSVLLQTANEFSLKAQLKILKIDYDSAQILFGQSRKYFETVDNLWEFAYLLGKQNQTPRAIEYYEKALKIARSESEEAAIAMNLGNFYKAVQKMAEAEKMYLRSLDILERLAKGNPAQFEPDLAGISQSLGVFYSDNNRQKEAIFILGNGLTIQENLAKKIPAMHTEGLAYILNNLGFAHLKDGDFSNARECLVKSESLKPENSWVFRNWACFFALQNDVSKSIENLKKASELGYDDPDWVKRETSLEAIRSHVVYAQILEQIKVNKEKKSKY
ncbi:MAG: tetratricopeptide repeat protein [Saprospiraceae bacterium]